MPNTYKKIATVVVGSGGSSAINFTSIPQTFTDLKIVVSCRTNRADVKDYIAVRPNGSTTNDSSRSLIGDGSTASSDTESAAITVTTTGGTATASVFGNAEINIPNYTSANQKSISMDGVAENNATESRVQLSAGLWADTAAITSIDLVPFIGTLFSQYSTATLYGIGDVTASKFAKATGGLITYDSTYVYHTFTSSGIFTPNTALTADYLVVAGGGSGGCRPAGSYPAGGGGAGGTRCTIGSTGGGGSLESALSLNSQAYTVTIGAGGTGVSTDSNGNAGSNSVFATITSTGGGYGARVGTSGGSGGSGGGAAGSDNTAGSSSLYGANGGAGTSGQGYAGGAGWSDASTGTNRSGGGGGGAGAAGSNGTSGTGGAGGNGITTSISGISTTYGGGGGGIRPSGAAGSASGGTGGGGAGNGGGNATSGTANTGGGGGASYGATSGSGGSGIVIVRYPR